MDVEQKKSLQAQVRELREKMDRKEQEQEGRFLSTIAIAMNLPPPPPETKDDLVDRLTAQSARPQAMSNEEGIKKTIATLWKESPVYKRALNMLQREEKCQSEEGRVHLRRFRDLVNEATKRVR